MDSIPALSNGQMVTNSGRIASESNGQMSRIELHSTKLRGSGFKASDQIDQMDQIDHGQMVSCCMESNGLHSTKPCQMVKWCLVAA